MTAKLLKIDLSRKSHEIEEIPDKIIKQYLGGRGLGSYLLYKLVPPNADPLGVDNQLIFTAGPVNGTNFYFSPKANVNTKSPLTNTYLYSICSGSLAHQIKRAGFWAVAIRGIADSPTFVVIHDHDIEFREATSMWGMEPLEAQRAMLKDSSGKKAATVVIGPAGEQLVKYASIFSEGEYYRAFGRGGAGCVMGAKRLKGILVSGDSPAPIADKAKFDATKKAVMENIKANKKWAEKRYKTGTGGDTEILNEAGMLPTKNWQFGTFEGAHQICTLHAPDEWPRKTIPCGPYCPAICSHYIEIQRGPYKGAHCDGPEYEAIYSFGSNCGIDKFDAIAAACQICDEFGIDIISAGVAIGFAMECFERGLIGLKDTDGIELRFGNDQAMIAMLRKMANQEGFGKRLLQGVKKLSEEIKGSASFAMHVKGLEFGGYECRGANGHAVAYATIPRGACHHAYGSPPRAGEWLPDKGLEIEGKGEWLINVAHGQIIRDCIPNCTFSPTVVPMAILADVVSAVFGESWTVDDLKKVSKRIISQERLFNAREGFARKDDKLPARLLREPKPDGFKKGAVVPLEELLDDFYQALGWDQATGNPTDAVLNELDIER